MAEAIEGSEITPRQWLTENWETPKVGQLIVSSVQPAVKTGDSDHLPKIAAVLWKANGRKVPIIKALDDNWRGDRDSEYRWHQRAVANVGKIRAELPEAIAIYALGQEGYYVMMPTLEPGAMVLLPDDEEKIEDSYPPELRQFAFWLYERKAEISQDGKNRNLSTRTPTKALELADILMRNFGEKVSVGKTARTLKLDDEKKVLRAVTQLREAANLYPEEQKYTVRVEIDKDNITKSQLYFDKVRPEDLVIDEPANIEAPENAVYRRDIQTFLTDYRLLDQLSIVDPNDSRQDARIIEEGQGTTWGETLERMYRAESNVHASIIRLTEIAESHPNKAVLTVVRKLHLASTESQNLTGEPNPRLAHELTKVINDVNTTVVVEANSEHTSEEGIEVYEYLWNELKGRRDEAWRLYLTSCYLTTLADYSDPQIVGNVERWLTKITELQSANTDYPLSFHADYSSIEVVKQEIARLDDVRKLASALARYYPVVEPELFLIRNKVRKNEPSSYPLYQAFSDVRDAQKELNDILTNNRGQAPIPEMLNAYANSLIYIFKKRLAIGMANTREHCLQSRGSGNMDFVYVEAVEPGGRNIIPLRVHNARYRIEPGEVKMLRDSRTGIVHLSDLDLPVVYYDSQIVTIDEAGKRNEVTIVSLN